MLTFEEKLKIIETFPQLQRKNVSLGRINFHYEDSAYEKKNVVHHLHPNGNGFVYAGNLIKSNYEIDKKGMVNIRDFSEEQLRTIIQLSIESLSSVYNEVTVKEERWINQQSEVLLLLLEDDWWNIYSGPNLEEAFGSYNDAVEYLTEEGFKRSK